MPRLAPKPRRRAALAILSVLCLASLLACLAWRRPLANSWLRGLTSTSAARTSSTARTPPRPNPGLPNTDARVKYVGDSACARCHTEISETYAQHPMGRSLAPVTAATDQGAGSGVPASFSAQGLEYSMERQGDRWIHRELRRTADGRVVGRNEAEARYAIGSGEQAIAFLLVRGDGYLFESPMTWYSRKRKWDLSPGYERDNPHFERFIKPACLFCHSNRFDHVEGTENRYREPIFQGHAIGCERCHGPGELHVRKPEIAKGELPNIVNPARLDPEPRESVCQQCHLQGDIRVVRAGRALTDFRPGMALSAVETVFVKADPAGKARFFGQVEQMYESRCFQASGGRMGCISCHDPHELPSTEVKTAYYRDRCLTCHSDKGCGLPREERAARVGEDHCIDCHMPRSPNEQVPHTATTLHLIPRFADRPEPFTEIRQASKERSAPLAPFPRDALNAEERASMSRDLGVALVTSNRALPGLTPAAVSRTALPLLQTAVARDSNDGPAWEAASKALWQLGRRDESFEAARTALKVDPNREEALVGAGTRAAQAQRTDEAIEHLERAIAINPWRADYHHALALAHMGRKAWASAAAAARTAVRLDPMNHAARVLLIECLMGDRKSADAKAELKILLDHDPPRSNELRDRYRLLFDQ